MKFQDALREKGLAVVGIHSAVSDELGLNALGSSVAEFGIQFPVLLSDKATEEAYGVTGIPTRVLVDRQGRVLFREVGFSKEMAPELERRIREATK